jgi:hypothetical protein
LIKILPPMASKAQSGCSKSSRGFGQRRGPLVREAGDAVRAISHFCVFANSRYRVFSNSRKVEFDVRFLERSSFCHHLTLMFFSFFYKNFNFVSKIELEIDSHKYVIANNLICCINFTHDIILDLSYLILSIINNKYD